MRYPNRGASLAETLIVVALTGIVAAMATGAATAGSRALNTALISSQQVRSAGTTMNELNRVVHAARELPLTPAHDAPQRYEPALVEAAPDTLTVYSYINFTEADHDPIRTSYEVIEGTLTEGVSRGRLDDRGFWVFDQQLETRVLANDVSELSFSYFDDVGNNVAGGTDRALDEIERRKVRSLRAELRLQHPDGTHVTDLRSTIIMDNLAMPWTAPR